MLADEIALSNPQHNPQPDIDIRSVLPDVDEIDWDAEENDDNDDIDCIEALQRAEEDEMIYSYFAHQMYDDAEAMQNEGFVNNPYDIGTYAEVAVSDYEGDSECDEEHSQQNSPIPMDEHENENEELSLQRQDTQLTPVWIDSPVRPENPQMSEAELRQMFADNGFEYDTPVQATYRCRDDELSEPDDFFPRDFEVETQNYDFAMERQDYDEYSDDDEMSDHATLFEHWLQSNDSSERRIALSEQRSLLRNRDHNDWVAAYRWRITRLFNKNREEVLREVDKFMSSDAFMRTDCDFRKHRRYNCKHHPVTKVLFNRP